MSGGFRGRSGSGIAIAAAGALIVLLCVLATLQYRWIGEVSAAERDRMRANTRASAESIAYDFDSEIARVYHHFAVPPGTSDPGGYIAASARVWTASVRSPEIVRDIYLARRDASTDELTLGRVDLATGQTSAEEWPASLEPARAYIEQFSVPSRSHSSVSPIEGASESSAHRPQPGGLFRRPGAEILDEIPALVIPPGRPPRMRSGIAAPPPPGDTPPEPWIIVHFDRTALVEVLLASLVHREFDASSDLDVVVERRQHPEQLVFRSRPGSAAPSGRARDAEASFFAVRPGGPPAEGFREGSRRRRLESFPPREVGAGGPAPWMLVVGHRSGSLQDAVDASRRRNLAVSGGILSLLVAAVSTLLVSAHRAQRLARDRVEFVAGITHELRTPLAAIRSAGQNLADGVVADPERVRRYGDLVEREGRRLSELIEQTLEHAGIEARRDVRPFEAVGVARVLDDAIAACRPLAAENGATFERDVPTNLPPVSGNPSALRTLFENLVSNAVKYGGRGGKVEVRARSNGRQIEVSVSDSGPGIAPRDLPRIFEPFYRGAQVVSGTIAGSGLGLSLVARIAESHGGSVRVENAEGGGARFQVTLPATKPLVDDAPVSSAEAIS